MSALWNNKGFRAVWCGQTASIFGDRVTGIALPWLILLQTHSAFAASLVAAARYVPLILFGLAAGVIADRLDRRRVMIACDLGRMLALGLVAALGLTHRIPPLWLLALVVLVLGTGQLGFNVSYRAWLPDLVGEGALGRANAALEASDAASTLAGPALGGVLIGLAGPVLALGADALSYLASALTLLSVRYTRDIHAVHGSEDRRMAHGSEDGRAASADALEGLRIILRSPLQRRLIAAATPLHLDAGAIELLLATLTALRLHLPAAQAGLVFGAAGIGGLIGSALAPRVQTLGRRGLAAAFLAAALASTGLAAASLLGPADGFAVALLANLLLDGAVALCFILVGTESVLITPAPARGRVNAVIAIYASLTRGSGVVVAGALAASGNPLPAFALLSLAFVAAPPIAWRMR